MNFITNVNPDSNEKIQKTNELIQQLKNSIPNSLIHNMSIVKSCLGGGISISFWSNLHKAKTEHLIVENSKLHISIMIHFDRGLNFSTIESHRLSYQVIPPAFRGIKKESDINKCIKKVVDYFNKNEEFYSANIENFITQVAV